jgi:4-amino-4-deoxy-L-arabinose transferase-like glycosyltransferase
MFLWGALALALGFRIIAMFWLPFVDTTEARYAEIARIMVETGDWITPQFDYGVPFWGKPPLHTWLSALGMKAFGVNGFGARILILMTALATLALIYGFVCRHRGRDQALVATVVLATSAMFSGASAFVMTDIPMVLGTVLTMVGFYNAIGGGPHARRWGQAAFVGLAIGMLAKGPLAVVITGLAIVPWLALGGRWRRIGLLPLGSGLLILTVLTLPWYIAAEVKTPGFLRYFLIGEHIERFIVSDWQGDLYGSGHARPKGMIWLYLVGTFLPWSLFALGLFPRAKTVMAGPRHDSDGWHSYLIFWCLAPAILFTPAANILSAYALPALPPLAILLVSLWCAAWPDTGQRTRRAFIAAATAVPALLAMVATLTLVAPQALKLNTQRELVAAARSIDPDMRFTFTGRRSFSADFYTQGQAQFLSDPAALGGLAANGTPDAVAIPAAKETALAPLLGPKFHRIGQFGRRVLFTDTPSGMDAS